MCESVWPKLLDLSHDKCRRILRSLELEAYSSIISAFRAQGDLNKDKKSVLTNLQQILSISAERHRAEVRRATNDERLTTVADNISGADVSSEWSVEGRRLVPLMPRLVPQTAFTSTADTVATLQAEKNLSMPPPASTGSKEAPAVKTESVHSSPVLKQNRPASPTSNVVVLPSGTSIHIKGGLNTEEEETIRIRGGTHMQAPPTAVSAFQSTPVSTGGQKTRRYRSSSIESLVVTSARQVPMTTLTASSAKLTGTSAVPSVGTIHPGKAHPVSELKALSKVHPATPTKLGPTQKVIIVSSASQRTPQSIVQKSITVPIVKGTSGASSSAGVSITTVSRSQPHSSVLVQGYQGNTTTVSSGHGNIITMTTGNPASSTLPGGVSVQHIARPRTPKTITATRVRGPQAGRGVVLAGTQQGIQQPTPVASAPGFQLKTSTVKPAIHIKQEGGMKIITQSVISSANKLLPKPATSAPISSVVMVSSVPSSAVTMVAKSSNSSIGQGQQVTGQQVPGQQVAGSKLINITSTSRIITGGTRGSAANVVTVNPKTLQFTTVKGGSVLTGSRIAAPPGTKPNVIVVQKAQTRRLQVPSSDVHSSIPASSQVTSQPVTLDVSPSAGSRTPPSAITSSFEKELVSFIQKQDSQKQQKLFIEKKSKQTGEAQKKTVYVTQQPQGGSISESLVITGGNKVQAVSGSKSSSLLAELIQAVGIGPEGSRGVVVSGGGTSGTAGEMSEDSRAVAAITSQAQVSMATKDGTTNQWVEYDDVGSQSGVGMTEEAGSENTDASTINALIELQQSGKPAAPKQRVVTLDIGQVGGPFQASERSVTTVQRSSEVSGNVQYVRTSAGVSSQSREVEEQATTESFNLDPQTGLYYTSVEEENQSAKNDSRPDMTQLQSGDALTLAPDGVAVISGPDVAAETSVSQQDFLSSALTQAQIDLDPYQFIDEEGYDKQTGVVISAQDNPAPLVSILNTAASVVTTATVTPAETMAMSSMSEQDTAQDNRSTLAPDLSQQQQQQQQPPVVHYISSQQSAPQPAPQIAPQSTPKPSQFVSLQDSSKKSVKLVHHTIMSGGEGQTVPAAVEVESTGLDVSQLDIGDYSSQCLETGDDFTTSGGEENPISSPHGSSLSSSDGASALGKRKRKAPPTPDEVISPTPVAGWVRLALGLVHRVSRFRGSHKEKGEMNASSWFIHPVDPADVPDYYEVIKKPMDLTTIRKKLESGSYSAWEDFDQDMMQIRENCIRYNREGTMVRRDCDELFAFYAQEYEKMLQKWQAGHVGSPVTKKVKLNMSPIRP